MNEFSELEKLRLKSWEGIKYFKPSEFDSPDDIDSGLEMNIELIKILDKIRHDIGFPLKINSGYRTESHNTKVGGKPKSAHTKGVAIDVSCLDSRQRYKLIGLIYKYDIKRFGLDDNFIHIDIDMEKDQEVCWFYPKSV